MRQQLFHRRHRVFGDSDPRCSDWDDILNNSRRVVLWGCDPLITNDVDWSTTLHNSYPKFEALKASGIKTIVVNPLRTQTGAYLESGSRPSRVPTAL